jgi:hypothetical protein
MHFWLQQSVSSLHVSPFGAHGSHVPLQTLLQHSSDEVHGVNAGRQSVSQKKDALQRPPQHFSSSLQSELSG